MSDLGEGPRLPLCPVLPGQGGPWVTWDGGWRVPTCLRFLCPSPAWDPELSAPHSGWEAVVISKATGAEPGEITGACTTLLFLVPAESRRVKLQGILADLRDVDGLPPKVTGPPPGTPQPRPHEGKSAHPKPCPRHPLGAMAEGGCSAQPSWGLWALRAATQPPLQPASPSQSWSVCLSSLCVCPVPAARLSVSSSCDSPPRALARSLPSTSSPSLPLSVSLSLALPAPPLPLAGSFGFSSDVFIMDTIGGGEVSLGDLADLTVTNDNELSCDVSSWLSVRGRREVA